LESILEKAFAEFPVVLIVGPRQSGKTTPLKMHIGERIPLVSLETPDMRLAANNDPRGFLGLYPPPVSQREIQKDPFKVLPWETKLISQPSFIKPCYTEGKSQYSIYGVLQPQMKRGITSFRSDFGERFQPDL
jgi:hypothetical protein